MRLRRRHKPIEFAEDEGAAPEDLSWNPNAEVFHSASDRDYDIDTLAGLKAWAGSYVGSRQIRAAEGERRARQRYKS